MNSTSDSRPRPARTAGAVAISLALALSALAETKPDPRTGAIEALVVESYSADAPGAAVLAIDGGETVYRGARGMADLELDVALEPDMIFRLGSITKQFTAVAILMLEEEGKLSVGDDVRDHLPTLPDRKSPITVEHLLHHTSGIPSYTDIPGWMQTRIREDLSDEEMLAAWKDLPLEFEPGTRWKYNNSGYFMLGMVVEAASGVPYAEFLRARIFEPLGMTSTSFEDQDRVIAGRVEGYQPTPDGDFVNAPFLDMDQPGAAGSLISTLDDLAKWNAALGDDTLLSADSKRRMWTPVVLPDGTDTGYGYGWSVGEHAGQAVQQHGGGIFGFATDAIRIPERGLYVAVLSNGAPLPPSGVAQSVARILLGEELDPEPIELPEERLRDMVGVYRIDEETTRVVSLEGGQLFTQRGGGRRYGILPLGDDWFVYPDLGSRTRFVRDASGAVSGMEMHRWAAPPELARKTDEAPPTEPTVADLPIEALRAVAGRYELAPGFVLRVWEEDGRVLSQATGQGSIQIFPESETVFFNTAIGGRITFVREDSAGPFTGLVLEQGGRSTEAPRLGD